ncbi:protein PF14_0175-like [Stegodyphus dumicola]|uniref:protein PF14_0175-like n=1 Tax=Stegodyphus dumicola TaxID=202533 RepID=UPI0015B23698|nr:protein PF14_0175-like [Stegodyphus dumicola]
MSSANSQVNISSSEDNFPPLCATPDQNGEADEPSSWSEIIESVDKMDISTPANNTDNVISRNELLKFLRNVDCFNPTDMNVMKKRVNINVHLSKKLDQAHADAVLKFYGVRLEKLQSAMQRDNGLLDSPVCVLDESSCDVNTNVSKTAKHKRKNSAEHADKNNDGFQKLTKTAKGVRLTQPQAILPLQNKFANLSVQNANSNNNIQSNNVCYDHVNACIENVVNNVNDSNLNLPNKNVANVNMPNNNANMDTTAGHVNPQTGNPHPQFDNQTTPYYGQAQSGH